MELLRIYLLRVFRERQDEIAKGLKITLNKDILNKEKMVRKTPLEKSNLLEQIWNNRKTKEIQILLVCSVYSKFEYFTNHLTPIISYLF